jgi:CheY-like chemotaxis protein
MDRKIVIIDDSAAELRLCTEALTYVSHNRPVVTFTDARSAYDYIYKQAEKIFVIICDVKMPHMNGPELLERINANPQLKFLCTPFIFLTNSDSVKDVEQAYALAAQGYFQKPMHIDALSDIFRSIFDYWGKCRIPRERVNYND